MPCQKFYAGIDILLRAFSVPVPRAFIRALLHVEGRHAQFGYAAEIARLRAFYTLRDNIRALRAKRTSFAPNGACGFFAKRAVEKRRDTSFAARPDC